MQTTNSVVVSSKHLMVLRCEISMISAFFLRLNEYLSEELIG